MSASFGVRRLLVTGATGFIGRHLFAHLLTHDVELFVMGRSAPTIGSAGPRARVTFLPCDFTDPSSIDRHRAALQGVEAVAHLGGFVLRSSTVRDDDLALSERANVEATARLLHVLPSSLVVFCYISTLDVYGPPVSLPIDEDHPTRPASYYGVSKLAAEGLVRVYGERAQVPVTVLRLSQVYGPGDTSSKAIPNFIRQLVRHEALTVGGDGSDVRDYVYVEDVVTAIVGALARRLSGVFNIATGTGCSLRDLVATLIRLTGDPGQTTWQLHNRPVTRIVLDISRAQHELGYVPAVGLESGLERTVNWFRDAGLRS